MRVSILRYPFSGRYVRRTRYSSAHAEVPTDVQGESTMDFTSPCAIRYSLTRQKSSSHVLLCLDEEPALGQDDPLLGGQRFFGGQQRGQIGVERIEVRDLPRCNTEEEHDIAECSVGGFPIVCPRLNDREAGCLEAVLVAMEQVAEILHPGKERPELSPSAASDLLGQDASVESHDPDNFRGIEFLVPIQHEVETRGAERKLQTATPDHRDSAGS